MDADERRLITPYRAPTIAERKKWLFMAEDRQRPTRQGENLASQSPSLNKLRLSTVAKVRLTTNLFRRSKKMNKKPPIPEKSDRIKNMPVARPRKGAPPPKPLPYNVHRSEMARKPDPAPRKVSRQGNGVPAVGTSHQVMTGSTETVNVGGEDPSVTSFHSPMVQLGDIGSRPRLDTPVTLLDSEVTPRNGVSTPLVAMARGSAAAPLAMRPRPPVPDNKKRATAAMNGCRKPPLPPVPKGGVREGCSERTEAVYSEAYGGSSVSQNPPDDPDNDMYSTIADGPRAAVMVTPTPSQTPPTPLSRSLTPPVPHPRSSQVSSPVIPPTASSPSNGEYSVTSHAVAEQKSVSPVNVVPDPTPLDTYSMLARPDQPNRTLNPAPSGTVGQVYSSLALDEVQQLAPPAYLDEGYSHLEFEEMPSTGAHTVAEHYEMNTSPVEGVDLTRIRCATNPDTMGIYEEIYPQDEGMPHTKQLHCPLSSTRSVPLEEKRAQNGSRVKPKVVPRQLSEKSLESRDHSRTGRESERVAGEGGEGGEGTVVGVVKLAPAPSPRTWKKQKKLENGSPRRRVDSSQCAFGEDPDPTVEDEDLYTIPPDAEHTPEPSLSIQEMVEAVETRQLESASWDVSAGEGVSEGGALTVSMNGSMALPDEVEDGRESSSSFLRDCLNEFAKKSSELHVMVDIDQIKGDRNGGRMDEKGGEEEGVVEGHTEDGKICRHSYENQEIVDQNKDRSQQSSVVAEHYEVNAVDHVGGATGSGEAGGATVEDPQQYSLETVRRQHVELDAQGYCKVEVSGNDGLILSLVEDVLNQFDNTTLSDLPPLSQDDDITNYDMKTVEHPPVTTNAQGYSYCEVGLLGPSGVTSASAGIIQDPGNTYEEPPEVPAVRPPQEQAGRGQRLPEKAPKPLRQKRDASNDAACSMAQSRAGAEGGAETREELSDNDSLYARVMDIKAKKDAGKRLNSPKQSPKPSPKPKRKKPAPPGGGGKVKRKGQGPRRRPPPPPPPGAKVPNSAPLPPSTFDAPPTPPLSAPCLKKFSTQSEGEHRFEQTLPPFPSHQSSNPGSPLHQRAQAADDPLTSSLPPLPPSVGSPRLPGRKGPLPPSPTAGSSDPPSPIHRRGLLNRIKSSSLKSRKPENHSPTTVSPLLTDDVGRVGDQSPKIGWKNKFRFRRGSGNSASAMEGCASAGYSEEYGAEASNGGGAGQGEWRRRRNQEDKLPEVPQAVKSQSLPSPARKVGSGIHLHPYEGEEEEVDDGLYSVVNKTQPPVQPPAAAIKAEATNRDEADQPSKTYEVIPPSVFRARTGSRGKNDVVRRSNSVEHLAEEAAPNLNEVEEGERVVELGSHSATSSPLLPRRRVLPAPLDHRGFHHGTLPRKKPAVAPPPKSRHVYATVIKGEEAATAKGAPPTTLPKPRRGGGVNGSESETRDKVLRVKGATNFDIPTLEVVEPLEVAPPSAHLIEGANSEVIAPEMDATTTDKPRDEDTISLQGLPSSEIQHQRADDGQIYAVINKKSKKKKKKKKVVEGPVERTEVAALEVAPTLDGDGTPPARKPPTKPPRVRPPKPAPYVPRVGSPIPAILAAVAAECSAPLPPLSPMNCSPPTIPDCLPVRTAEEPHSPLPSSPLTPSHFTTGAGEQTKGLPQDVEKQRARLSLTGPPSFPPPPPPQDPSSSPSLGHTYETPPATLAKKSSEEGTSTIHKPPAKLPAFTGASFASDADIEDELTPGYDVVSKPKINREKKPLGADLTINKTPPTKQRSLPDHSSLQPSPTGSPLHRDGRAKSARSNFIPRSPHLYEPVDDILETKRLAHGAAKPPAIVIPRRSHIYESAEEVKKKICQKGPTSRKRPPPPAPPVSAAKVDNGVPSVTTQTADDSDSANGVVQRRTAATSSNNIASPVAELVNNPMTYLGTNMAGKRLTVDIQYDVDEEEERESSEPKFLFNKGRISHFIHVGQDKPDTISLSPGHSSTTQSSSSVSVYEDDSDADIMYSTDWESSSGEEDEEEEEEEEGEEGRIIEHKPARTKTFYIAHEILTTERTYVKGLKLIDKEFRSTILSANRAHDKPVVTEDTLKLILGNVSSILTLNAGMLAELEERMKIWDTDPRIGDIILNRAPYLKIYSEYISRFDKALKTLEETTKRNPQFARVLREFEAQPVCAQLPLAGYMLETVQRIPRYKLLLTDYVKHLPEKSPDRAPSEKALDIISSVATHVNETIRQMDNFRKVMEVRKKLIGDTGDTLITPYRKLIKEGLLLKFSRKEPQPRMFFLFNDILIYASSIPPTNNTYKVIKRIPLEGMRVEMVNDPDMRHGFQIISTCKSFRLEASSNEELHQWIGAFETAIKEHREKTQSRKSIREQLDHPDGVEEERIPLGHLAPPWLPDSAVSMCQLCSVQFTVTRRRHHCRACGQIFCSDCSSYLAPLRYKSDKLGRVCQLCYESICGEAGTTTEDKTPKRSLGGRSVKSQRISLPSVLREVKARDQNVQISAYLLSHATRSSRWRKKWFIVYNLVLYEFEKHEDVTAKCSVALPSYQIDTTRRQDPLVFCLRHPGTGKLYFKADTEENRDRWLEVLEKAVKGEIGSPQEQQAPHTPIRASSPQPDNDSSP